MTLPWLIDLKILSEHNRFTSIRTRNEYIRFYITVPLFTVLYCRPNYDTCNFNSSDFYAIFQWLVMSSNN